jgi:glyoxylase-like metal-dependent hydrolase (beta-lactamase superfamily II)
VRGALGGGRLATLVNTHLHSDHCGGNATLKRTFGCRIAIPPGQWQAVLDWDEVALSYAPTGQRCERFVPDAALAPGGTLRVGDRHWQVLSAPGHDPHSVILFDAGDGIAITADALWQRGFGVTFPELDGEPGFEEQARVLDLIERLGARHAIPGHGAPFDDVPAALAYARKRLQGFRADPQRHRHHAMKALFKYHLLEEQQQAWPALLDWFRSVSLYRQVWQQMGRPGASLEAYAEQVVKELGDVGALTLRDGVVSNA